MIHYLFANPKVEIEVDYVRNEILSFCTSRNLEVNVNEESTSAFRGKIEFKDNSEVEIKAILKTFSNTQQLEVIIEKLSGELEFSNDLEMLKIGLKNQLKDTWEECFWIKDFQSSKLSALLYVQVHKIENDLREIVNLIMLRNYGINWWEKYASIVIQKKYRSRTKDFSTVVPAFKGVNDKLLSIDVDDLLKIMKYKRLGFDFEGTDSLIKIYEGVNEYGDFDRVIKTYKDFIKSFGENLVIVEDLWIDTFSDYFDTDFFQAWNNFKRGRNHIAHNKLVDLLAHNKISRDIGVIQQYINGINDKLRIEPTDEELEQLTKEYIEVENSGNRKINFMSEEAGVKILDENEILEKFAEVISEYIEEFKSEVYFRDDIEISDEELINGDSDKELLAVFGGVDRYRLTITSTLEIYDEPSQVSELVLKIKLNGEIQHECQLKYENGEAVYDDDKGYYMPVTYNDFEKGAFKEFKEKFYGIFEDSFPDYKSELVAESYSSIRDGGLSLAADFPCEECGKDYVCLDERILPYGKCANCGHIHNITSCIKCEYIYNENLEGEKGMCDGCYERWDAE